MDRKLLRWAFALLFVQIIVLVLDMGLFKFDFFYSKNLENRESVGHFVSASKSVKSKSQKSLIWENQNELDNVHYYDSILTLEQSSAEVLLKENTKLSIAENTLVVIEPPKTEGTDRLRLIFRSGHMRSDVGNSSIESNSWVVEAESGSDVNLTTVGDKVEVEVSSGKVKLENSNGVSLTVGSGEVLSLSQTHLLSRQKVDADLKFDGLEIQKIYSHFWPKDIELKWQGKAKKLVMVKVGAEDREFDVDGQNHLDLQLQPGSYTFKLVSEDLVSSTIVKHFWQAPIIHLIAPLPRDRVLAGESVQFLWQKEEYAHQYRLEFSNQEDFQSITNQVSVPQPREKANLLTGSYFWRVVGLDETGAEIPSLYSYRIYSLPNPLQAPKMALPKVLDSVPKAPGPIDVPLDDQKIRAPASSPDGATLYKNHIEKDLWWRKLGSLVHSLASEILPYAHATSPKGERKKFEAIFNWETVPGAQTYTIEISSDPLFRNPLILKEVLKNEFVWKGFDEGRYFWRVAAGGDMGPMGYYSPVATVNLIYEGSSENRSSLNEVKIRTLTVTNEISEKNIRLQDKDKEEKNGEEVKSAPSPFLKNENLEGLASSDLKEEPGHFSKSYFGFGVGYSYWNYQLPDSLKVSGANTTPFLIDFGWNFKVSELNKLGLRAEVASTNLVPKDPNLNPFQPEVELVEYGFSVNWMNISRPWSYELKYKTLGLFERVAEEEVGVVSHSLFGLGVRYTALEERYWNWWAAGSIMGGNSIYDFAVEGNVLYRFSNYKSLDWALGFQGEAEMISIQGNFGWRFLIGPQALILW